MSDYEQPDFYHFNEDSLKLVTFVTEHVSSAWNILDAGAGCGVIGIELAKKLKARHLTLLEVQDEYSPFLKKNISLQGSPDIATEVVISSFSQWNPSKPYDLIVSNPPYYLPGHGEASGDPSRDIARSFKVDGWRVFLEMMMKALSPNGKAFVVIKNNKVLLHEIHRYLPVGMKITEHIDGGLVYLELLGLDK